MNTNQTASERIGQARVAAEDAGLAYELDLDGHQMQERLAALQGRRERKDAAEVRIKDRRSLRNTLLAAGAIVATAGALVVVAKETTPNAAQPNPNQITEISPTGVAVTKEVPRSQMTPSQRTEHDFLATGQLGSEQP